MKTSQTDISNISLIICGIVRDCAAGIKRNRPLIDKLCAIAKDVKVVIFENDSKDATKALLKEWSSENPNLYVQSEDYNTLTFPMAQTTHGVNPAFSAKRITKMAYYRNKYLEYINENHLVADYVIVVDMDLWHIDQDGILQSLSIADTWDMVAANGVIYSPSAFFRRRYNDTFALVEYGEETSPQTEESILAKQYSWAHLKKSMPLVPVYSAFGGLAVYRYQAIKDCKYEVLVNSDPKVEVRCEHFAICKQMHEKGYNRIFVNPAMKVVYTSYGLEKFLTKIFG